MPVPAEIARLVQQFREHLPALKSEDYKEARLRVEYLDPFFIALGWDVYNKQGYAPAYQEVIHEDAIKVGGVTKAPDYAFRVGGVRKFFVEAKSPRVDIKLDIHPAFQLRRYAWSAKLPLSILTDFEEFAVYDTRVRPEKNDNASAARILYMRYSEYAERWDEIAAVFTREAIQRGAFDKYVESTRTKKGTAEVDAAFLAEIERWRELLARNFALRNPALSVRELNFAVQQTIDRIVFLRICEDRGIEPYATLQGLVNGANTYARLVQIFHQADHKYNSGLFHFEPERGRAGYPDTLTTNLALDDRALKEILKNLYYPDSPYEFSVLPADILGQVYEQFLGKVIVLSEGHRATVEERPEVKKAGGVYYTPTYIVDYIVRQTVGKLVEGRKAGPRGGVSRLRIVDPACGSGSFLLGAYQFLLDWHLDQYVNDPAGPESWERKSNPQLYRTERGEWRLTIDERKRILLNTIYGVDIDPQAVEVTKLSLLLKVLEGESAQTLSPQLALLPDRVLPDLARNVRCGNSLIGPDFYDRPGAGLDAATIERVNPFDWRGAFPEVFAEGGFDAVIGNPPYIRMEAFKEVKFYLKSAFSVHAERSDIYAYFIERAHLLLRQGGRFGMIVSNKFLRADYGQPLREFLRRSARIVAVTDFAGLPVFKGATVRTIVLLTSKDHPLMDSYDLTYSAPLPLNDFLAVANKLLPVTEAISPVSHQVVSATLARGSWSFAADEHERLIKRLESKHQPLKEYARGQVFMGVKSGLTDAFIIDNATRNLLIARCPEVVEILKPVLNGRDIRRYSINFRETYLIYTYHGVPIKRYPSVEEYLRPFKSALVKRATKQEWYELQQPQFRFARFMEGTKIIFPDIATKPRFALDEVGYFGTNTTYFIPLEDKYLLAILNSSLAETYFKQVCAGLEGGGTVYLRFFGQYLENFPVRAIDPAVPADVARHDRMVDLVQRMLELHKQLAAASTPFEKERLQRQIEATDGQIDALVYELYGLTAAEIRIVEGAAGG